MTRTSLAVLILGILTLIKSIGVSISGYGVRS